MLRCGTKSILFIAICLLRQAQCANIFNWFWSESSKESTVLVADGVPLISIPYETMTEDEKFLQEAAKFTDIQISSPLETCQHKVVMRIKTSCGEMSEEQLAKLSVNLLNCQSAVEGRKLFPCTDEMSLKQCTTDMDADMWNAYHLMSNRARAVCYTSRSTQFRALTELTVNKLMQTAHSQIQALSSLKESQKILQDQTLEALGSLSEGNKALLRQQEYLRDAQTTAHNLVARNLRELNNEKALIRAGHAQLASLTEDIKAKLEKSSAELMNQAMEQHTNHREVLEDLMKIQDQAQMIWEKIESSTNRIVEQNTEAAAQYEETLVKLGKINETIHFIWNVTESMRTEVDEKLGWITEYIGDTSEQLNRVYRTSLHIIYLLGAMVVASFLQAPFTTRVTIMGIIPVNLMTFLKHGMDASLDFTSITVLIFMITGMHYLMVTVQYILGPRKESFDREYNEAKKTFATKNGSTSDAYREGSLKPKTAAAVPATKIHYRLITSIKRLLRTIVRKLINWKNKIVSILQSAASLCRQNSTPVEELSCSYLPSKKSREDLITDYAHDFPNMSEDSTDFENSVNNACDRYHRFDDSESLIDATDLRRRITGRNISPARSSAQQSSASRSVTPNYAPQRNMCGALTKSGSKCRSRAALGGSFCGRHRTGASLIGD